MSDRALNRALLARQGLLEPFDAPVVEVVEAIGALQAQAWAAPPVALWSRMLELGVEDLHAALERGDLVTGISLRATLHLVSAREHPAYRALAEPQTDWRRTKAARTEESDGLRAALLEFASEPRSGEEIAAFADAWAEEHPEAIPAEELEHQRNYSWKPLLRWAALIRVPADGHWGAKAPAALLAAPGEPPPLEEALAEVVRRHLRAFGPAGPEDVASWTGLNVPPVRKAFEALELEEVDGLFDLPGSPRPDPDVEAPPRFLAAFDSALLAYPSKRRGRIVPDGLRDLVYVRRNLQVKPTFLVDGRVAGIWAIEVKRREATLTLTPGTKLSKADRAAVIEEGERLVRWAKPDAKAHHVDV